MGSDKNSTELSGGEVGYRSPPKHSQFKKGASGNPKGRPKGTKSFAPATLKISLISTPSTVARCYLATGINLFSRRGCRLSDKRCKNL